MSESASVDRVGLVSCDVLLVGASVFWLDGADLVFLKGSAVSSSRFWRLWVKYAFGSF